MLEIRFGSREKSSEKEKKITFFGKAREKRAENVCMWRFCNFFIRGFK